MKYLTHIQDKIKSALIRKIYYQQRKCFHGCLHSGQYCKKKYAVWYFCLCRSPSNKFLRQIARQFFRFTKKFFPLLTLYAFFQIFLPQLTVMFSTDLYQSVCSFIEIACEFAIKRDSKNFVEFTKGIERLQQKTLLILYYADWDSEQVQ